MMSASAASIARFCNAPAASRRPDTDQRLGGLQRVDRHGRDANVVRLAHTITLVAARLAVHISHGRGPFGALFAALPAARVVYRLWFVSLNLVAIATTPRVSRSRSRNN